jgi:hypothetical protein
LKSLYPLAAVLSALLVATLIAFSDTRGAKHDARVAHQPYLRVVALPDARHMALIANARRHGMSIRFSNLLASQRDEQGGLSWTHPGLLASLSLAVAVLFGGAALAGRRRRLRKPRPVSA